jgi:hypothetical protein
MQIYDGRIPAELNAIRALEEGNQELEAELSQQLCLYFGTRVRSGLSEIASTALEIILWVGCEGDYSRASRILAHSKINFLDVVKTYGRDFGRLMRNIRNMTPSHCSDIIRMYGEWIEGQVGEKPFGGEADASKKGFRKGLGGGMRHAHDLWHKLRERYGLAVFGPRSRLKPVPRHLRNLCYISSQAIGTRAGGINIWNLANHSAVGKMDRVFGLLEGADISGTTTDTCYLVQSFGLGRMMHMLPLGTLVYNYHHTWLEVALALSINRQVTGVDYDLGYYTSCLPAPPHGLLLQEHFASIQALFTAFEDDYELIVKAYMPGGKPWCLHFTRAERNNLRQSGKLKTRWLLNLASNFSSTLPTPGDVLHLFDGSSLRFQVMDQLLMRQLPVE